MDQDTAISTFLAVAPGATPDNARQYLEATGWSVESAMELYFASEAGGGASTAVPMNTQPPHPTAAPTSRAPDISDPEYVRPAIAARTDILYGEENVMMQQAMRSQFSGQNNSGSTDPFRDFGREAGIAATSSATDAANSVGDEGLAALFRPPTEIMFSGTLEQAKQFATEKNRWLLVNLQSNSEFASHRLNRDTWSHDFIKNTIESNFVLWQVYDHTDEGRKVETFYRTASSPVTMIVDPITGAKQKAWPGFVDPEILMEDLMMYMEAGPLDGGVALPSKRKHSDWGPLPDTPRMPTEEEELARALAMSLEESNKMAGSSSSNYDVATDDPCETDMDPDEPSTSAEDEAAERIAEAVANLPAEPEQGAPESCRIALRLADGARIQRRFLKSDPVHALQYYCIVTVPEAAQKPFSLSMPGGRPGAPPVNLTDMDMTLGEAGVVGAMIQMAWVDP